MPRGLRLLPQSARNETDLQPEPLMDLPDILAKAEQAKAEGATRSAWERRGVHRTIGRSTRCGGSPAVADLGMETCVTLGMHRAPAKTLADAGLDYYNHNLDTSPDFYGEIITTRTYQDRLDTLAACREVGISLCSGGIVGMGETRRQRAGLLQQLAILNPHPESVPINLLIQVPRKPLHGLPEFEPLEWVRTIAAARIVVPESTIRMSAGRSSMSEETHALCLHAGASSIFSVIGSSRPTTTATMPMLRSRSTRRQCSAARCGSPSNPEPVRPDVHTGRSPTMLARSMMRTSG